MDGWMDGWIVIAASRPVKSKKVVLSQGEPRDAAVNFETYCILQRHRTCGVPVTWHGFLVGLCRLTTLIEANALTARPTLRRQQIHNKSN